MVFELLRILCLGCTRSRWRALSVHPWSASLLFFFFFSSAGSGFDRSANFIKSSSNVQPFETRLSNTMDRYSISDCQYRVINRAEMQRDAADAQKEAKEPPA